MTRTNALLVVLVTYFVGSIPFGAIVARVYGNVDLTKQGSGRTGATNVLRTLGKGAAAVVFGGDFFKGVFAVILAGRLAKNDPWAKLLGAMAACIGHAYSPFIGFKGGRSVTTGLAATFVIAPWDSIVAVSIGGSLMKLTRYVSLGSIVGAVLGGMFMVVRGIRTRTPAYSVWGVLVGGFIVVAHRDNIQRLLAGTERRFGEPVPPA